MENKNNYVCKICKKEFSSLRGLGYHISCTHNISAKEYYDKYLKKEADGTCKYCGKPTPFLGLRHGYQKYCCAKCGGLGSSKQGKATMLQKYGKKGISNPKLTSLRYKNYSKDEKQKIIEKCQKTRIKNYGSVEASYQAQAEKSIKIKQQDIEQFEKDNDCTMLYTLVHKYGQG